MKKTLIILTVLTQSNSIFARTSEIQKWSEVIVPKGYVLSLDLYNQMECDKIWSKQIKEFKKHNKHIKDPNKLFVNQKILVQDCRLPTELAILENDVQKELEPKKEALIQESLEKDSKFIELYMGVSKLSELSNDTGKKGYSFGITLGKTKQLSKSKELNLAIGIMHNASKTNDSKASSGE